MSRKPDRVWGGVVIRLVCKADGYVMVRQPHCAPFVLTQKEWEALPDHIPVGMPDLQKRTAQ